MTTLDDCRLIELTRITRAEGSLTPVEGQRSIPFPIARVYYLYDIPGGAERGGHAHRNLEQLIVSVMGAFDVVLDDGRSRRTVRLDRAYQGLYLPPMIWRELRGFSSGAICVVLASLPYDEGDYLRTHGDFVEEKGIPGSERSPSAPPDAEGRS